MKLRNFLSFRLFIFGFIALSFTIGNIGYSASEVESTIAAEGYPYGYRTWANIDEEGVVFDESSAFFGARSGYIYMVNPFPCEKHENSPHMYEPGDRIVLEFSHVEHDEANEEVIIGDVLWLAVMTKVGMSTTAQGAEPTEETSGWKFQAYDDKKQALSSEGCFSCHKDQVDNDFVFFEHE